MDKANQLLTRRIAEIIDKNHLEMALRSSKKLRVKLGIDPNRRELHLGHAVALWKLREFQEEGHTAVFIVGDWTAMIGDPSGRDKTRPSLSESETKENARHFFKQAYLILDKAKTEVHLQSEWFKKFGLKEVIRLSSLVTEKQILAHETFRQRIEKDLPFYHHETIYPLLQGYDSVAVKADLELGAMEQKFNLLMGRVIQKAYRQKQQDVMMVKYLIGLDGKEKMSKSFGNYIALIDTPDEMFGKVMSLPDRLIEHYFELCTSLSSKEIGEILNTSNPKDAKIRLAFEIAALYHGGTKARTAEENFDNKFSKRNFYKLKPDRTIKAAGPHSHLSFLEVLVKGGLAASKSEAKRKIAEGAVRQNDIPVSWAPGQSYYLNKGDIISLGKRFLRIK